MGEVDCVLVSVIIPMYNVEKYISKCINSVRNQTYKGIEILCIDDGSTDHTLKIALEISKDDSRIRVVEKENEGLSETRNMGMDIATGEYIYFLDADDAIKPDTIEELVRCAETHQLDTVFFNAETIFESKQAEEKCKAYREYYFRKGSYTGVYTGEELFVEMIHNWDFKPSVCLLFSKRSFLVGNQLRFYPGILHEDNLFTIVLMQKAQRVMLLNRVLYERLVREESIVTADKNIRHAYGLYICQREILKEYGKQLFSYQYYTALRKYLKSMQKQAVNAVMDESYERLLQQICSMEITAAGAFLEYVENAFVKDKRIRFSATTKQSGGAVKQIKATGNKRRKTLRGILYKCLHKCKAGMGKLVPKKVKWIFSTIVTLGPGYFVYRKKLKYQKDKICVSIVMPIYNAEPFLRDTLDSLVKQNLWNIEIICVDDGSTDGSQQILQEYASKDARIQILTQKNLGAGAARNKGLQVAKGEYLLFLDADDIFHESLCNRIYYQCIKKKADICLFGARRMNMETMETEPMNWVLQLGMLPLKTVFSGMDINRDLFQMTTGCPWNKMFRREFVLETGIVFQNLQNANDAFFVRMHLALAERIAVVNERFVTYRFNTGTNIQSNKGKAPFAFYEAFRAIKDELIKREVYAVYEQSFCNMVLRESLFNMHTTGNQEMQELIKERLIVEIFPYFGLAEKEESFYYNPKEYQEMMKMYL